jgi:hypothetical protein
MCSKTIVHPVFRLIGGTLAEADPSAVLWGEEYQAGLSHTRLSWKGPPPQGAG